MVEKGKERERERGEGGKERKRGVRGRELERKGGNNELFKANRKSEESWPANRTQACE